MIHLDTSFLVDLLREAARAQSGRATRYLATVENESLAVSMFVVCELFAGAELSQSPKREIEKIVRLCGSLQIDFPHEDFAPTYGRILASLERAGQRIAAMDQLIATSAVLANASLVTSNLKHFFRIPDLTVVGY